MKLSVIIITYNQGKYIRDALEGVIKQKTSFPFEVIVADDCSTDGTLDICKEYIEQYPYVKIEQTQTNLGYQKNWERSLQLGCGEYVAIFEGDDYWINQNKLQLQVDYMDSHIGCGLCYTDCDIAGTREEHLSVFRSGYSRINVENPRLSKGYLGNVTWLLRREEITFLRKANDFDFEIMNFPLFILNEYCLKSQLGFIPIVTGVWRIHSNSFSNSISSKRQYDYQKSIFLLQETYFDKFSNSEKELSNVYTQAIFKFYKDAIKYEDEKMRKKIENIFPNLNVEYVADLKNKYESVINSCSFKIGDFLIHPLNFIKRYIHEI